MSKIAVVACSNSGIDYLIEDHNFDVIRCKLVLSPDDVRDDFTQIKANEFYKILENSDDIPKTSLPTPYETISTFENLAEQGYTDAIYIPISKGMSNTYNTAKMLTEELKDKINVHVFDCRIVSGPQAFMTLVAKDMADQGKFVDEIIKELEHIRSNTKVFFCVKELKYLVKNGRLSSVKGAIGTLLKFKPILTVNEDEGRVVEYEKIRTFSKALQGTVDTVKEKLKGKKVRQFYILDVNNKEVVDKVLEEFPEYKDITMILPMTPVVGIHPGPGTIVIGYTLE